MMSPIPILTSPTSGSKSASDNPHPVNRLYIDHAATTPLTDRVKAAMRPWMEGDFGNASSLYEEGRMAREDIDQARERLSAMLGCLFAEVLFTSSGTEAANLAVIGSALASDRRRILMSAAEHHCVLETQPLLERLGFRVEHIPVNREASVDLDQLEGMMGDDVALVSCMHANNEFGTIQPVRKVADIAHRFGAWFHCDAVQTFGAWPWPVSELDADLITLSAHKVGGPKGAGGIYIRAGIKPKPLMVGGGQEREMRAGTENVAAIVGFGAVVRQPDNVNLASDAFRATLDHDPIEGLAWTVSEAPRLASHQHFRIAGIDSETMLIRLDREGVSASAGAACSAGSIEPSHVMLAAGFDEDAAVEGLRFSFGGQDSADFGREAAARLRETVAAIRDQRA